MQGTASSDLTALAGASLDVVVRYVVQQHHDFATAMVTVLRPQLRAAVAVESGRAPSVIELASAFDELALALLRHTDAEESEVFPALVGGTLAPARAREAEVEHERIERLLKGVEAAVSGCTVCEQSPHLRTVRTLLAALAADVRKDLTIENALLFASARRSPAPVSEGAP